jgi:hypothetical protein
MTGRGFWSGPWRSPTVSLIVSLLLMLVKTGLAQDMSNSTYDGPYIGLDSVSNLTNSDGDLLYGQAFAPDVLIVDTPYDNLYDDNESANGTLPVLDDSPGDNSTDVDPFPDNSTYNIDKRYAAEWDDEYEEEEEWVERRDTKPFYLRVMPLGASVTQGHQSSDNNGYRKWLREELRYQGWPVNMVGSLQDGTMKDRVRVPADFIAAAFNRPLSCQTFSIVSLTAWDVIRTTRAMVVPSLTMSVGFLTASPGCSRTLS